MAILTGICLSVYTGKIYLNDYSRYIVGAIDVVVMFFNITLNSAVVFGLVETKQLYNASFRFILALCISDFCLGVIVQPLIAVMFLELYERSYCNYESATQFLAVLFTHASGYIIAVIGFDRYCRMKYLNRYQEVMTNRHSNLLLTLAIVGALGQATLYTLGTQYHFLNQATNVALGINALVVLFIILSYIATVTIVRNHRQASGNQDLLNSVDRKMTSVASRTSVAVVVFYAPYIVISLMHTELNSNLGEERRQWLNFAFFLSFLLGYCNSFVNAIIFLSINKKCRRWLRRCIYNNETTTSVELSATPS